MKSASWQNSLYCGWLGVSLALLFGLFGNNPAAQAQTALAANRWDVEPGTQVYLDGQASSATVIDHIDDKAIASVEGQVVKGQDGYLVITTKANANSPATLALADKLHLMSAYTSRPAPISAIAAPALAYITSHYPKAWLGGEVLEMTRKSTGAVKYRVQLADNWGWRYVSFTATGDFVDDKMH
jgi:hypothetical protein